MPQIGHFLHYKSAYNSSSAQFFICNYSQIAVNDWVGYDIWVLDSIAN